MNRVLKKEFCIGIVSYNPDLDFVEQNIRTASNYQIYIADNGSTNQKELAGSVGNFKNILLISNNNNLGIAAALNQLCQRAMEEGFEWIVLFDQDSKIRKNLLDGYSVELLKPQDMVSIYTPLIKNKQTDEIKKLNLNYHQDSNYDEVPYCITSGSLTNISDWKKIQGFDEYFFIDYVDYDYCLKIYLSGKKILRVNSMSLDHSIGNTEKKFWFNITNHNEIRRYYQVRNMIIYFQRYKDAPKELKRIRNKRQLFIQILKIIIAVLLFEKNKYKKIRSIGKGLLDSKRYNSRTTRKVY
ncbi:glycosyltransferase [Enterococcus faecium]|uniref:glycosyltransferase n=1 Tax=Enterococcus faecium TaxID=1352 RepID=UPI00338D754A